MVLVFIIKACYLDALVHWYHEQGEEHGVHEPCGPTFQQPELTLFTMEHLYTLSECTMLHLQQIKARHYQRTIKIKILLHQSNNLQI